MELANYDDFQRSCVQLGLKKRDQWEQIFACDKWINQVTDVKNDITVDYFTSERGNNTLRAVGHIPYNIEHVFNVMT